MEMVKIHNSANIAAVGYDEQTRKMRVEFTRPGFDGAKKPLPARTFEVDDVSPEQHQAFMAAKSKGQHYHQTFKSSKGKYV